MARSLDELDAQTKQYGGATSGDRFEFKKGVNKMRILVFPEILATHFLGGKGGTAAICIGIEEGCPYHGDKAPRDDKGNEKLPSLKLCTYIIDREDGKVKLAELPLSVRYALKDLQDDEDFAFDDFPLPFDVKITHDPDNKDPKQKYRVMGSPNRVPITAEEQVAFDEKMARMTPTQYIEKRKAKSKGNVDFNSASSTQEAPPIKEDDYPESAGEIPF